MDFFSDPQLRIIFQLVLAIVLGGLVGLEREWKGKEAGLRTYMLVSLGAALFTIISLEAFSSYLGKPGISVDPSRIVAQIVLGVGFIGAGLIVLRGGYIEGLTTAAGLWVVAAIGVAIGTGLYILAVFAAFLAVVTLAGLRVVEEKFFEERGKEKK